MGSTDLDGNARLRGGKVDMGAYEYPGPTTATLSATSLSFGIQPFGGNSAVQNLVVTNAGPIPLQISSISATGDFSQSNNCPSGAGMAPSTNCVIAVTFTPTARGGRQGSLSIVANTNSSPYSIPLAGTAIGAVVTVTPSVLAFPNQDVYASSAPQSLTITNLGDYALTVGSITATAQFTESNACTSAIPIGSSCVVSVVFTPTSSGTQTGTLTITSNAVGGPQVVNMSGNGEAALPAVTSLTPASALAGGAPFNLTVQGSGFIGNSTVRWNGSDRPTTFVSQTQLSAAITAADVGSGGAFPVTVFNPAPGGGSSGASTFTVANRVPTLTSISPTSALVGGANFQLTVFGTGFAAGAVIRWNGTDRPTTFLTSGQLRADISALDISFASTTQITVFNPAPGGGTSGSSTFSALAPTPLPVLTSISPQTATAGDPGFTLVVGGSGFTQTSVVQWNRTARQTTYVSDVQLQAQISAGDILAGGTNLVAVVNPAPGGGTSASSTFTVIGNPLPLLFNVSPASLLGGAPVPLTLNGSGFTTTSVALWNGVARPTSLVNGNQLVVTLTPTDTSAAGSNKVAVYNPPPGGGTTSPVTINVNANPVPVISGMTPSGLPAGTASQAVQIRGSNFNSGSVIRWNGQNRPTTVVDASTLSVLLTNADLASPNLAEVRVYNPPLGGGSSAPLWFPTTLGMPSNGMVYDATRGLLWISVPSTQPKYGNSIVSVDPATGKLGSPIFVGSEPGKVVISDDGHYLYAALNGTAAVRRVDLTTQTADLQFAVGTTSLFGTMYAEDMSVMPGNAHAIAISRAFQGISPRHAGVAIYDDGVARANTSQTHTGSNRIEFSSSPSVLYGFNNETTEFGFRILSVDAQGVKEVQNFQGSPIGGFGADFRYDSGRIYATSGAILNPDTGALFGRFSFPTVGGSTGSSFGLAPDGGLGRSFYATGTNSANQLSLTVFDNATFTPIGTLAIPGLSVSGAYDDDVVRWGGDGLAVRGSGQIFLIRSSAVKPATFTAASLVTAGSLVPSLTPGGVATAFGAGFTPLALGASAAPLPTSLAGVSVTVNNYPAPLYYASPSQINFQVPWETAGSQSADVTIGAPGFVEKSISVKVSPVLPAIFTTGDPSGQAIAVIAGTSLLAAPANSGVSRPAQRGEILTIYCTGLGSVANTPVSGSPASDASTVTNQNPAVMIGGATATPSFSGLAPGLVGVYQLNVQVPDLAATGDAVPLVIALGASLSNTATVAIR